MDLATLIDEGPAAERPSWLLRASEDKTTSAIWHAPTPEKNRRWITIDATFFPMVESSYISVLSDGSGSGAIECLNAMPELRAGDVRLAATKAPILPPIDAVFVYGSERVGSWLAQNGWQRDFPYNPNFADSALVEQYERIHRSEHPFYSDNTYAMIGGWHTPFPEGDWSELLDEELLVTTFRDAEPWLEAWRDNTGRLRVIERVS